MTMNWLLLGVGLAFLLCPIICLHRRFLDSLVRRWAMAQGVEVVSYRWRPLLRGPFFWRALTGFDHTEVFEVRVRDGHGRVQQAWICCYIPLAMIASNPEAAHVDVQWVDAADASVPASQPAGD